MCLRVRFKPLDPLVAFKPWDADGNVVTLPDCLTQSNVLVALRAVLEELAVDQPEFGAVCWCGAPVVLLPRFPIQRRSEQVMRRGA